MSSALPDDEGPSSLSSRWRAVLNGVVPVLLGLGVGVAVGLIDWSDDDSTAEEPPPTQAEASRYPGDPKRSSPPSASYRPLPPSSPFRLVIPAIDVDMPVVPIQTSPDQVLQLPPDPDVAGWWEPSAQPGASTGQTLISGHAVRDGSAPLNRVRELKRNNVIDVVTAEGRMRYRVTHTRVWSPEAVAAHADELFGQDVAKGRLVLVTCTDWNGEVWLNNVIAYGLPLGEPVAGS